MQINTSARPKQNITWRHTVQFLSVDEQLLVDMKFKVRPASKAETAPAVDQAWEWMERGGSDSKNRRSSALPSITQVHRSLILHALLHFYKFLSSYVVHKLLRSLQIQTTTHLVGHSDDYEGLLYKSIHCFSVTEILQSISLTHICVNYNISC